MMLQTPVSLALREAMQITRLKAPLLPQSIRNCRPAKLTSCSRASSITTLATPQESFRKYRTHQLTVSPPAHQLYRFESTIASPTSSSSTASPTITTSASSSSPTPLPLTWDRFLHLRTIRRRFNLVASISTALATTSAGINILSQQDLDKLGNLLFGIDPIMAMGLSAAGCGAVGWLLGPFAGNAAFGMWYRRLGPEIALKEKQFYQHIKRRRVDPSSQSMSNPVPDYYGEKITSLKDYRRWLKDQKAFTKKRQIY